MVKVIGAVTVGRQDGGRPNVPVRNDGPLDRVQGGRDTGVHAISFPPHRVSSLTQNEPEHK